MNADWLSGSVAAGTLFVATAAVNGGGEVQVESPVASIVDDVAVMPKANNKAYQVQ